MDTKIKFYKDLGCIMGLCQINADNSILSPVNLMALKIHETPRLPPDYSWSLPDYSPVCLLPVPSQTILSKTHSKPPIAFTAIGRQSLKAPLD